MAELVPVSKDLKGYVIGRGGSIVKHIQETSGAKVYSPSRDAEGFMVKGNEEQRALAKSLILQKVEGGKLKLLENKLNKICFYIDAWNLPENSKLKLEKAVQDYGSDQGSPQAQYRLKAARFYSRQESRNLSEDPIYFRKLEADVLDSLQRIKREMERKQHLKADMWCHFGTVLIRQPTEGTEGEWSIEDVSNKLLPSREGNHWKTEFRGGVNLDETFIEQNIWNLTHNEYEDYSSRYDLAFATPCGRQLRFKVWVIKKNVGKKVEDIPIPFSDVKNILDEIHFEDELTRSRCRGWLVLPSRRHLQADILFPGCEFDCRLTIRERIEKGLDTDHAPKEEKRCALLEYLSKVTFTDEDDFGLRLPGENFLPPGFKLYYRRCSKRALYGLMKGFSIILSKESTYGTEVTTEGTCVSKTDLYLHCEEWDDLLNKCGNWEPEEIAKKLPEFFRFVKKVQSSVIHGMKHKGVPPEILARGSLAVEYFHKAIADGKTSVKRVPIMLIGQEGAGKTSLKKSLKGILFNPEEDSTVGIDVDPSHFMVTTAIWRTGTTDKDDNSDAAISFEHQTANCIADNLKKGSKTNLKRGNNTHESSKNPTSELAEKPRAPSTTKQPGGEKGTDIVTTPRLSRDIPSVKPNPNKSKKKDDPSPLHVPEEVAIVTATLLQSELQDNKEDIYSVLWDFAGQSVYYTTHPLFLTERAIYCLLYDLSLDPNGKARPLVKQGVYKKIQQKCHLTTNLDSLDFWMMSVASLSKSNSKSADNLAVSEILPERLPAVFLVCTHADTPFNKRDPSDLAHEILGCLRNKPYGDHLAGVFFVDNTKSGTESECPEVVRLRQEVLAISRELPHIPIAIKWLKFDKALQEVREKGHKYITLKHAKEIASNECHVKEEDEFETLMNYFHDLRILIHFDDSPELNEMVVLDLQWLIDVFKKVITVQPYKLTKKKFVKQWEKLEKEGILNENLLTHVWEPLLDNRETFASLIAIMEKFSLLCPWPSDDSENETYLVPSMLKSHPPDEIINLVESAQIPSMFVNFENGHIPPGLFPRFLVQFVQWGKDTFLRLEGTKLFHNFARFFVITDKEEVCSINFICHPRTVQVVVLSEANHHDTTASCAHVVCVRVDLLLQSMRNEFRWLRNMKYEMSVLCPICSSGVKMLRCLSLDRGGCNEEEGLHFLPISKLHKAKKPVICTNSGSASKVTVNIKEFSSWFPPSEKKELQHCPLSGTSQGAATPTNPGIPDRPLKATLLASEWGSSMGGLSTINRTFAIQLAKHNQVKVTLFVPQKACSEEEKKNARQHNIEIKEATSLTGFDPLDCLSFPPRDLEIDVVIGHGVKLGKQAQVIRIYHGCKWVQVVHTVPEELGMHKEYSGAIPKGAEKHEGEVGLCKQADLILAVGPKLKEAYFSSLRSCKKSQDIIQLTPGAFPEFSTTKQSTQEGNKFRVLTLGRGDPEDFTLKGYDIAAKAIAELKNNSYHLLFVGAPTERLNDVVDKFLQYGISKSQLTVRKFVKGRDKLKDLFCEVDLALMPSRTEGFGLSALEALSAGLPILVASNSGLGEVLLGLPSGNSYVVESDEPRKWAKAIKYVRGKAREERLQEIQRLRRSYEEKYSWKEQCDAIVERISSIVYDKTS